MNYYTLAEELEKIKKIEFGYEKIISDYLAMNGKKAIWTTLSFIPPEINAAFNIVTLKIPDFIPEAADTMNKFSPLFDNIVTTGYDCICNQGINSAVNPHRFRVPSGFGEDAAVSIHNEISLMLKTIFDIELKSIDIETLKKTTAAYENLRRIVRSISSLRDENINLLSNRELSLIYETALILPPDIALNYINPVLEEMKKINDRNEKTFIRGMLYGGKKISAAIADSIEKLGIIIVEDDSCTGRRSFDISLNADSEYIFYEILDAYSYRPLTPCLKEVNDRYELLYRLLKNYNIETVIFYKDETCRDSANAVDYLRIKMMRDGIDPLVIDKDNYKKTIKDYLDRI